ncbi:hypothetical protein ACWGE0_39460 [Lentzea sp. NPDC054927]
MSTALLAASLPAADPCRYARGVGTALLAARMLAADPCGVSEA